jgi:FKBP-type peptidyl-prolyl cis-trans isomerase 2
MVRRIATDRHAVGNLGTIVLMILAIALISGVWLAFFIPGPAVVPLRVQDGDRIAVNYVGYFQDTNLVFDTSLEPVAADNASWPKAVSFSWRGSWQTYGFRVGDPTDPQRPVPGFEAGIRGMSPGETRVITVTPDVGYGSMDPDLLRERPLLESVPVRLQMTADEFQSTYGSSPASGSNVLDPFWGWRAVVEVAGSVVVVTNSPGIADVVQPYGAWEAEVVAIDDTANGGVGEILVRHRLDASDENRIGGETDEGEFYLSDVDLTAGMYTMNFNREVVGRTLVFRVTLVTISRL